MDVVHSDGAARSRSIARRSRSGSSECTGGPNTEWFVAGRHLQRRHLRRGVLPPRRVRVLVRRRGPRHPLARRGRPRQRPDGGAHPAGLRPVRRPSRARGRRAVLTLLPRGLQGFAPTPPSVIGTRARHPRGAMTDRSREAPRPQHPGQGRCHSWTTAVAKAAPAPPSGTQWRSRGRLSLRPARPGAIRQPGGPCRLDGHGPAGP
jgi:hypothetical protein